MYIHIMWFASYYTQVNFTNYTLNDYGFLVKKKKKKALCASILDVTCTHCEVDFSHFFVMHFIMMIFMMNLYWMGGCVAPEPNTFRGQISAYKKQFLFLFPPKS